MDALELCNSLRMEFEGVYENKIPLDALPVKLQDMVLALARQENYSIEYTLASLLVAASTAIGNAEHLYSWRLDKQCCHVYDIGWTTRHGQDTTS